MNDEKSKRRIQNICRKGGKKEKKPNYQLPVFPATNFFVQYKF